MDHRRIFSLDEENFPIEKTRQLVKYLHDRDQHYIVMIDPAVAEHDYRPYKKGIEDGIFVKDHNGNPFRGVVWPVKALCRKRIRRQVLTMLRFRE